MDGAVGAWWNSLGLAGRTVVVAAASAGVYLATSALSSRGSRADLQVGDRVRVLGEAHGPGHSTGTVAELGGRTVRVRFDADPTQVHRWYTADELARV